MDLLFHDSSPAPQARVRGLRCCGWVTKLQASCEWFFGSIWSTAYKGASYRNLLGLHRKLGDTSSLGSPWEDRPDSWIAFDPVLRVGSLLKWSRSSMPVVVPSGSAGTQRMVIKIACACFEKWSKVQGSRFLKGIKERHGSLSCFVGPLFHIHQKLRSRDLTRGFETAVWIPRCIGIGSNSPKAETALC